MARKIKDIEVLKGKANPHILLIAPHAPIIGKKSMNDRNTGIITEQIQKALKCSAIINGVYRKPKNGKPDLKNKRLDFNIIEHAKLHPTFLDDIKKVVDSDCKTLVVWIHGMADSSAKYESKLKSSGFNGAPDVLDALIGYGQGPNPNLEPDKRKGKDRESRPTANKETVEKFRDLLIKKGLTTNLTRGNAPNFRGRDPKRMNQWFRNEGYKLTHVESIQLEIREKDFRDNPKNCRKAAKIISQALSALIRPQEQDTKLPNEKQKQRTEAKAIVAAEKVKPNADKTNRGGASDDTIVDVAYEYLKETFRKHFHNAMVEAGQFIINEFFDGDHELAKNPRNAIKIHSLNQPIQRLQENSGHAPSKTWVYDAVKLAIDENEFQNFRTYGKLGLSHKIRIAYVKEPEVKKKLIQEAVQNNISVKELRSRIAEERRNNRNGKKSENIFWVINNPDKLFSGEFSQIIGFDNLNKIDDVKLDKLEKNATEKIDLNKSEIVSLSEKIKQYEKTAEDYERLQLRISLVKEWHAQEKARNEGKAEAEFPKETSKVKKLREAVKFMCFWRGYDYATLCVDKLYKYRPIEELHESQLEKLLRAGKCNLKACWNFEITKKGEFRRLSQKKVWNRIEKGTFWLSEKQYIIRDDPNYYDYK